MYGLFACCEGCDLLKVSAVKHVGVVTSRNVCVGYDWDPRVAWPSAGLEVALVQEWRLQLLELGYSPQIMKRTM